VKFIFGFFIGIVMGALLVVSTIAAFLTGIAVATCGNDETESTTETSEETPAT
jgi:uncharacterized membrane protein YadS